MKISAGLIERYKGLIKAAAGRYAFQNDALRSKEDLEQEGWLVLCKTVKENIPEKDFESYFKSSLWNTMKRIAFNKYRKEKTFDSVDEQGVEERKPVVFSELEEDKRGTGKTVWEIFYRDRDKEAVKERVTEVGNSLQGLQKKIFNLMISPTEELLAIANRDWKLRQKRQESKGDKRARTLRILHRHIVQLLSPTWKEFNVAISEIKRKLKEIEKLDLERRENLDGIKA